MAWLDELIAGHPATAPALVEPDGLCLTYGALRAAVAEAAEALREAGVAPGDRVMLIAENSAAVAIIALATSRLRAWFVPVNARLTAAELAGLSAHAEPRMTLYTMAAPAARAHAERDGAESAGRLGALGLAARPAPSKPERVAEDPAAQVAALVYTSGTTGQPKGVMLSHRSLVWNAQIAAEMRGLGPQDQLLLAIPATHIMALATGLLAGLQAGASVRLMARFSVEGVLEGLAQGASVLSVVPQVYRQILARLEGVPPQAPQLRQLGCGGAPLDSALKAQVEAVFGLPLHNGYGMTEAGPGIASTTQGPLRADGSVGYPFPGLALRLDRPDAAGVGELLVRGPGVMLGYYRAPGLTAEALTEDGFLRTGDLVRQDPDGALHLVGRAKELIIRSGFNVYPVEVESVLLSCPGVLQAAVTGRPTDENEEVLAFVTLAPGTEAASVSDWLNARLAPYKRPQHLVVVEAMPMTAAGKIRKAELVALALPSAGSPP